MGLLGDLHGQRTDLAWAGPCLPVGQPDNPTKIIGAGVWSFGLFRAGLLGGLALAWQGLSAEIEF